jgi:hypothetical protein
MGHDEPLAGVILQGCRWRCGSAAADFLGASFPGFLLLLIPSLCVLCAGIGPMSMDRRVAAQLGAERVLGHSLGGLAVTDNVSRHRKQKMSALVALEAELRRMVGEEPVAGNVVPLRLASYCFIIPERSADPRRCFFTSEPLEGMRRCGHDLAPEGQGAGRSNYCTWRASCQTKT